jgi:hypothetical protein
MSDHGGIHPRVRLAIRYAPAVLGVILIYGKINGVLYGDEELEKCKKMMEEKERERLQRRNERLQSEQSK